LFGPPVSPNITVRHSVSRQKIAPSVCCGNRAGSAPNRPSKYCWPGRPPGAQESQKRADSGGIRRPFPGSVLPRPQPFRSEGVKPTARRDSAPGPHCRSWVRRSPSFAIVRQKVCHPHAGNANESSLSQHHRSPQAHARVITPCRQAGDSRCANRRRYRRNGPRVRGFRTATFGSGQSRPC